MKFFAILWIILLLLVYFSLDFILGMQFENIWIRYFLTANIVSFALFGLDKIQARTGGRRIPENILHIASLLGGPIGALIGMHLFRHKTRKLRFQIILAGLIFVQVLVILLFYHVIDF